MSKLEKTSTMKHKASGKGQGATAMVALEWPLRFTLKGKRPTI